MARDSTGAISGTEGDIFKDGIQICEAVKWTFKPTCNTHPYSSNCTEGYKKRVRGVKDSTCSVSIMHDPGKPMYGQNPGQMREGDYGTLSLYLDDFQFITMPMITESFSFEVDMDEGSPITADADCAGHGAWSIQISEESSLSSSSSSSSSGSTSSSSS
jgi:hypothetical protein